MNGDDIRAFFATRTSLESDAYIELDYTFECVGDPQLAAAALCREQSTAQWARIGVIEDFRPQFGARVVAFDAMPISELSLPVRSLSARIGGIHRVWVTIAHPHRNFGPRLPNLLSAVLGEGVFYVPGIPIIRLEDIRFPHAYLAHFTGPRFGAAGIRGRLQAFGRPIFIGVVKPNIGLAPEPFAALAEQAWRGGLDIAKDDEMLGDTAWSPLLDRATQVGAARRRAEDATQRPKMYLANITDEVSQLVRLHDAAVERGANAVLLNALPVGLSGVRLIGEHTRVPIFTHFPMLAALTRIPGFGVRSRVWTRLQRLAGADAVIMPGFGDRMGVSDVEVMENVTACLEAMGPIAPVLPVPGGSDSPQTLERVYRTIGGCDFGFVCGRGIFGHPAGAKEGAQAVRAAWDALHPS